jgi:hypothetical protein
MHALRHCAAASRQSGRVLTLRVPLRSLNGGALRASRALLASRPLRAEAAAGAVPDPIAEAIKKYGQPDPLPLHRQASAALAAGDTRHAYGLHPDAGAVGTPGLIQKYGWAPLLGLGLAAAVSKELLILNEELLIVCTFSSAVFTAYAMLRDQVLDWYHTELNDMMQEQYRAYDQWLAHLDKAIEHTKAAVNVVNDHVNAQKSVADLVQRVEAASAAHFQAIVNAKFEERLAELEAMENRAVNRYQVEVVNRAMATMRKRLLSADPKVKNDIIDNVVASLEGRKPERDPVRDAFKTYFLEEQKKFLELRRKGLPPLTEAQRAEAEKNFKAFVTKTLEEREAFINSAPPHLQAVMRGELERLIKDNWPAGYPLLEEAKLDFSRPRKVHW